MSLVTNKNGNESYQYRDVWVDGGLVVEGILFIPTPRYMYGEIT